MVDFKKIRSSRKKKYDFFFFTLYFVLFNQMTTTFKQTYSKVMEELINEKKEYYKYLKHNNHLSWCKGKMRRRWIIFIRRKYTMPLYMKQKKEVKKEEEPRVYEHDEVEPRNKFNRVFKFNIKSYKYKANQAKQEVYINATWFRKATNKDKENMENDISNWEAKYYSKPNRGGKADWNYHVLATLQGIARNFTYSFSNRMTSTCYTIQRRSQYNTHFTISQKWWERATDEDLQNFNRKIITASYINQ